MKVIIVITSRNYNEFERWVSRGTGAMVSHNRIEITNREYKIIVLNGRKENNQPRNLDELAVETCKIITQSLTTEDEFAILFHGDKSEEFYSYVSNQVNSNQIKYYSSGGSSSDLWENYIQPFFNQRSNLNTLIEALWKKIHGKTPEDIYAEASRLRAEILTPLVAMDLIKQAKEKNIAISENKEKELKTEILNAIKALRAESNDKGTEVQKGKSKMDELFEIIQCQDLRNPLNELLKNDTLSADDFHMRLNDVALKMEKEILKLLNKEIQETG